MSATPSTTSTLLKAIDDTETTLMFSEVASFPLVDASIQIGTEIITYVSNYNGTLYGLTRGANSSTAASHSIGSTITLLDNYAPGADTPVVATESVIGASFDGGGSALAVDTASTALVIPFGAAISKWTVVCTTGSITVDVRRTPYASYSGTTTSIVGGGTKPFVSSGVKNQAAPASWASTSFAAYDVVQFVATSVTDVTKASIVLTLVKT